MNSLSVDVKVTHSYIGDLKLSLISPSGKVAVLHDREGSSANDINTLYDVANTPSLAGFAGERVNGDWLLHVQDLARFDRGRLIEWSLEITGSAGNVVEVEDNPGQIIPDNAPVGIERILQVTDNGSLDDLSVELDITHTFIGDLSVVLVSPGGIEVILHNRSGGSSDNLIKTYSMDNTLALQALRGESVVGDWKLRVRDHASADQGKLNHWALKIEHN